jgi:predicted Zn finger-like uncharacterized protein
MDVRCERCRAQYVFDDDQVTEAGLAVQCSNCGHVFRVKKKALVVTVPVRPGEAAEARPIVPSPATRTGTVPSTPAPQTTPIPEKKEWRVRQANGNVFTFKELTTLQKWIVEKKVSRDDEISLSGDQWKRLGNIAELATFFQVVEAAERGQVAAPAALTPLPMPVAFPSPAQYPPGGYPPPASYPPHAGFSAPIPLQGGISPSGAPVTQVNVSLPANPTAAWEGQTGPPRATAPEPAWTSEPRPRLDELEEAELRAVKGGGGKWVLLLVLLLAGGAAAVYLLKPELVGMGKPPPPPPPVVEAKKEPPPAPPPPEPPKVETPPPEKAPVMVAEPPPEKPAHKKAGPRTAASLIAEAKRLRDRGKAEQALDLYGQAAEIEPDSGDALAGRGWCYLDMSQYAPAEASFQGALEREAGHADALMGLAETYRYQGRKADAVKYYERYLALHPEGDDAVAARNAISQLKE